MTYRVDVSPAALADAELAYFWMQENRPDQADSWFNGLQDAVRSLAQMPARCPLAPESEELERPLRQLIYGKGGLAYRVLFTIEGDVVRVHLIRNTARARLTLEEIENEP